MKTSLILMYAAALGFFCLAVVFAYYSILMDMIRLIREKKRSGKAWIVSHGFLMVPYNRCEIKEFEKVTRIRVASTKKRSKVSRRRRKKVGGKTAEAGVKVQFVNEN